MKSFHGEEIGYKIPPLAKELLAIKVFYEKSQFSLKMSPLVGHPQSGGKSWSLEHMSSINYSMCLLHTHKKKTQIWMASEGHVPLRGVGRKDEYDKKYTVWNYQKPTNKKF